MLKEICQIVLKMQSTCFDRCIIGQKLQGHAKGEKKKRF